MVEKNNNQPFFFSSGCCCFGFMNLDKRRTEAVLGGLGVEISVPPFWQSFWVWDTPDLFDMVFLKYIWIILDYIRKKMENGWIEYECPSKNALR